MQHFQARHKWHKPVGNIKVGDIVLLKDNNLLRRYWQLACIVSVYLGPDSNPRRHSSIYVAKCQVITVVIVVFFVLPVFCFHAKVL